MADQMQRIVLAARPEGKAAPEHFRMEAAPMPEPGAGEVLAEILWLSLDPYMRGRMNDGPSYAEPVELGGTMTGEAVGRVITSRANGIAEGDIVSGMFGWASHGVLAGNMLRKVDPKAAPIQTALGVLGMPGFTGWLGLTSIGQPVAGETLAVAAATGPVGSMVGQLAKLRGLRTIGIAGGAEKCRFATAELGFDACLDHRAAPDARSLRAALSDAAPEGIDIYFENVGDKVLAAILPLMRDHGRIPVCGTIGWYQDGGGAFDRLPAAWRTILVKRLRVEGFIILDHFGRFPDFIAEVAPLVASGQIAYRESVAEGLEAAPGAFLSLLEGGNFGKQLVRIAPE